MRRARHRPRLTCRPCALLRLLAGDLRSGDDSSDFRDEVRHRRGTPNTSPVGSASIRSESGWMSNGRWMNSAGTSRSVDRSDPVLEVLTWLFIPRVRLLCGGAGSVGCCSAGRSNGCRSVQALNAASKPWGEPCDGCGSRCAEQRLGPGDWSDRPAARSPCVPIKRKRRAGYKVKDVGKGRRPSP